MFTVKRSEHNPLLSPVKEHPWEAFASFNGCPVIQGKKSHIIYRAASKPDVLKGTHMSTSVIGRATTTDGISFEDRSILIAPGESFDKFGCEDPRVTKFEGTHYIFYTALGGYPFSADNIKVAVALSKDLKTVQEKHLVTPFNAKAMALFPERINGKVAALLTAHTDLPPSEICYAEFDEKEELWSEEYWKEWHKNIHTHALPIRRLSDDQVELGAAPLKTKKGWLVIYSHIQRYTSGQPVFGIEALLLDLKNPRIIVGRTKGPFMVPDAYYEHQGQVPNVIFPSGAIIKGDELEIHYGAADTHCAIATIPLDNFLRSMIKTDENTVTRFVGNPIISPRPGMAWEERGTFNPAAIDLEGSVHILYRAVSNINVSTFGYARSKDGISIDERSDAPVYGPRVSFEQNNGEANSNCGCEDPRLVVIGKKLFITYTAYDGRTPRVAISSISIKDFLAKKWDMWSLPEVVSPEGIDDKDAVIIPEPIKDKYLILHRIQGVVCADYVSSLDFSKEKINECIEILGPRWGMWDGGKVGIASPPIKTKKGWVLLYHGVSWSTTYRIGAVLLDLKDPTIVRARTAVPIFGPQEEYERKGIVPNVVFPCGNIVRGDTVYIYYGAADLVLGVATIAVSDLLTMLEV